MSCCGGCFEGLSKGKKDGGGGSGSSRSKRDPGIEQEKSQSQKEIAQFHTGLDFISKVPLFKSLPLPDHPALAKAFTLQQYSDKQCIIKQGDVGCRFFCIKSGVARVIIDGNVEAKLKAGDYFGEQALLNNAPRNATIEAEGKLECQELSRQDFESLDLRKKLHFKGRKAMCQGAGGSVGVPTQKTPTEAALIMEALRINKDIGFVFENMIDNDLQDVVAVAFKKEVTNANSEVITQGDLVADLFYILEQGSGEAILNGTKVASYTNKDSFGGLALLYQAPRAATVRVTPGSKLWCIPRAAMRGVFQAQVAQTVEKYAHILQSVKCLDHVSGPDKKTLADALLEMTYYKGETLYREGEANGTTFYILKSGELALAARGQSRRLSPSPGSDLPYFGERALIRNEPRAETVSVISAKVTVLVLSRDIYEQVVKHLEEATARPDSVQYSFAKLKTIALLGCGGFGKVTLVTDGVTGQHLALKALSKGHLIKEAQQASVMNEKKILRMTHSPFLVQVAATFNQKQYLYFLLEPAMGGELFTIYMKNSFYGNEKMARFYSACVLRGLEHLHDRCIIYRDMKPENLLLDIKGYCKIADFGLAKFVIGKTFTTCGTPDYFAPELLKGTGHTMALDWWTLGILIYEFMTGVTPFQADSPDKLFNKMMKGIDRVDFPRKNDWPDLVKGLCKLEPSERLTSRPGGTDNVINHQWYTNIKFDWQKLTDRTMAAPWDPKVKGFDGSNFDASEDDAPPDIPYKDPGDGWDNGFEDVYGPCNFD